MSTSFYQNQKDTGLNHSSHPPHITTTVPSPYQLHHGGDNSSQGGGYNQQTTRHTTTMRDDYHPTFASTFTLSQPRSSSSLPSCGDSGGAVPFLTTVPSLSSASLVHYADASAHAAERMNRIMENYSRVNKTTETTSLRSLAQLESEVRGLKELYAQSAKERDISVSTTLQHMGAFLPPRPSSSTAPPTIAERLYQRTRSGSGRRRKEGDIALSTAYARSLKLTSEFTEVSKSSSFRKVEQRPISSAAAGSSMTLATLIGGESKVNPEQTPQRIHEEAQTQHALLMSLDRLIQAKTKQICVGFDFEQRCGNPFEMSVVGATNTLTPSSSSSTHQTDHHHGVVSVFARGDGHGGLHSTDADLHVRISKAAAELAILKKRRVRVDTDNHRASTQLTQYLQKLHGF